MTFTCKVQQIGTMELPGPSGFVKYLTLVGQSDPGAFPPVDAQLLASAEDAAKYHVGQILTITIE